MDGLATQRALRQLCRHRPKPLSIHRQQGITAVHPWGHTRLVMTETHEGAAGNHTRGRSLALKVKSLGFFWPTMNSDCEEYARRCDMCQRHAKTIHCPTEKLRTLTAPYPFMRWAMDIIGPMPNSRQRRFILVLTDYFTKWIEAESYVSITDREVQGFV